MVNYSIKGESGNCVAACILFLAAISLENFHVLHWKPITRLCKPFGIRLLCNSPQQHWCGNSSRSARKHIIKNAAACRRSKCATLIKCATKEINQTFTELHPYSVRLNNQHENCFGLDEYRMNLIESYVNPSPGVNDSISVFIVFSNSMWEMLFNRIASSASQPMGRVEASPTQQRIINHGLIHVAGH